MDEAERPGLAAALDRADREEYDLLHVWKRSRLARSVRLAEEEVAVRFALAALPAKPDPDATAAAPANLRTIRDAFGGIVAPADRAAVLLPESTQASAIPATSRSAGGPSSPPSSAPAESDFSPPSRAGHAGRTSPSRGSRCRRRASRR